MIKTRDFIDSVDKLSIGFDIEAQLTQNKNLPSNGKLTQTKSTRKVFVNSENIYTIWNIKLPNKESNTGKNYGFRMIVVFRKDECEWFLHKIFPKKELTKRREKNKYDDYVAFVKKYHESRAESLNSCESAPEEV